jgi:shikimate dehydrogenase
VKRYALLGASIEQSLSPALHSAGFAGAGTEASYSLWPCRPELFEATVKSARNELDGFNLTAPFKRSILPLLKTMSPTAERLKSVNSVRVVDGELQGENTDIIGFRASLDALKPARGSAMILGSGGVCGALLCALSDAGFLQLTLCARKPQNGLAWAQRLGLQLRVEPWSKARMLLEHQDLIINATPLGLVEHNKPIELVANSSLAVIDLNTRPKERTAWVQRAQDLGLRAIDGRIMLSEQAIAAQAYWGLPVAGAGAMRRVLGYE